MAKTITVWFCTLCREYVQGGVRPTRCHDCGDGTNLRPIEVPFVAPDPGGA